jgi:TrmH family RNA methyltransferase
VKRVSSRDNPVWKMLVRLCHSSRDRRKLGKCVLEGAHTILAYLDRFGVPELIVINEEAMDGFDMRVIVERAGERQVIVADARLFNELAQIATPTGVLAVIAAPQPGSPLPGAFNLLLEDVQDPGNVGTMLRTAAAAGVTHAFLSEGCAFAWSPKVLRAGQGAHFFLEIVERADLLSVIRGFSGKVVAAVPHADASVFDADLRGPLMFMVGNEGAGLSAALIACATARVAIPMPGGFESLNAASAAAVCLFEKLRQERTPQTA